MLSARLNGHLQIHQTMIAEEEYKALKAERARRAKLTYQHLALDRSVCLLARAQPDDKLPEAEGVVGTLDLYAVSSVQGEVLIGKRAFPQAICISAVLIGCFVHCAQQQALCGPRHCTVVHAGILETCHRHVSVLCLWKSGSCLVPPYHQSWFWLTLSLECTDDLV